MNFKRVKKVKQSKAFTLIDVVIVAALIAVTVICAVVIFRKKASAVVITTLDGSITRPLSVTEDIPLEHLTVHISGGKVYVTDADCADKICERTGVISCAGQTIVCLPNGITVRIVGESDLQWEVGK